MLLAHIAGVPVEETLLALAPAGVAGVGALLAGWVHRLRRPAGSRRGPGEDEGPPRTQPKPG